MKTIKVEYRKRNKHHVLRVAVTIFSFWLMTTSIAFTQNSWIGGTPGAEQDWNNPNNWSEKQVPDWSDEIVEIQDVSAQSGYFPIIYQKAGPIGHLNLAEGATLTIKEKGKLVINGAITNNYGIINSGLLINHGKISIENTSMDALVNPENNIINKGVIAIIDYTHNVKYLASQ